MHCLSYCLLGNHFHLVIETPEPTLGDGMRDVNGRYAQLFNERHVTGGGHLFQGRFGSKLVKTDEQLAQLLRYVTRNPVAAGLCPSPERWPWSSHNALVASASHPIVASARVEQLLGVWGGSGGERYTRLFRDDGPLAHLDPDLSPWDLRPTLAEIFSESEPAAAIRRARRHGYRLSDVAAFTGLSEATISRRARG
jgi:hypothetical protein